MTELFFWETTIRGTPVSFAIDLEPAFMVGIKTERERPPMGWHDLVIYLGPLSLTFTVYGRRA